MPGAIRAVFQPIVRLADVHPIGDEGLAREIKRRGRDGVLLAPQPTTSA